MNTEKVKQLAQQLGGLTQSELQLLYHCNKDPIEQLSNIYLSENPVDVESWWADGQELVDQLIANCGESGLFACTEDIVRYIMSSEDVEWVSLFEELRQENSPAYHTNFKQLEKLIKDKIENGPDKIR